MIIISSCSRLCPIHWSQVLSREWRCSWSSADRRCSNYIWVIVNLIYNQGATYIRDLTVDVFGCLALMQYNKVKLNWCHAMLWVKLAFHWNQADQRNLIIANGLVILPKSDPNHRFFSPCDLAICWMTSQPIGNLFHALEGYVCHFIAIYELNSNQTFKSEPNHQFFTMCDRKI